MRALGISAEEIDIRAASQLMLERIGHPAAKGKRVYDVTYENVQAGERTSHLFRLANLHGALVLGTGDLSELALGFTTYGVGDHMSHYNVNASVPKTLIQHLIRWLVRTAQFDDRTTAVLDRIVNTRISPELVPGSGEEPDAVVRGRGRALRAAGLQPLLPEPLRLPAEQGGLPRARRLGRPRRPAPGRTRCPSRERREYDLATIRRWLEVFLQRFFQGSQFKRSAMPNGPKVGSGGSLSPRGDWRAPSDSPATVWLDELRANVPARGKRKGASASCVGGAQCRCSRTGTRRLPQVPGRAANTPGSRSPQLAQQPSARRGPSGRARTSRARSAARRSGGTRCCRRRGRARCPCRRSAGRCASRCSRARVSVAGGVGGWSRIFQSGWNAEKCSGTSGPSCAAIHCVIASSSASESFSPGISSVVISSHVRVSRFR